MEGILLLIQTTEYIDPWAFALENEFRIQPCI